MIRVTLQCGRRGVAVREITVAVVNQNRSLARQHIVRVLAGQSSPAFSLVSEFRPVHRCAWKCRAVRPCCHRRCRQTATCVRAVEWALVGVLPGLGSGMVRGPYAGPATRAGRDPARSRPAPPPGTAPRPIPRRRLAVGLALVVRARPASLPFLHNAALLLRGLVAGRPAVAEPRATRVSGSP